MFDDASQMPEQFNRFQLNGQRLERIMSLLPECQGENREAVMITLYETLLNSIVLTPLPGHDNLDDELNFKHPVDGILLTALENENGQRGLPVFTSEEAMSFWVKEPTEYIGVPFPVLCTHAIQSGLDTILINLAGPAGGEINHYELTYLAEGMIPPPKPERYGEILVEKDTEIYLSELDELPPILSERLSGVFRQKGNLIDRVYAFQVAFSQGPLKPAIGIRMPVSAEDRWDSELWPDILVVLQEVLESKDYINVFLLNKSGDLESTLQNITQPIFVSKAA